MHSLELAIATNKYAFSNAFDANLKRILKFECTNIAASILHYSTDVTSASNGMASDTESTTIGSGTESSTRGTGSSTAGTGAGSGAGIDPFFDPEST